MRIEEVINQLKILHNWYCPRESRGAKAVEAAIALLRAHPDAQPNEPLTLEKLRGMDGQPVWVKNLHYSDYSGWWIIGWSPNGYCVLASAMRAHMGYSVENYGINWLAYRRPSKEDAELMAWLYGDLDETIDAAEPQKEA